MDGFSIAPKVRRRLGDIALGRKPPRRPVTSLDLQLFPPFSAGEPVIMLDFAAEPPAPPLEVQAYQRHGPVILCHCRIPQNPGAVLGSTQFLIVLHTGPTVPIDWIDPRSSELFHKILTHGVVHVIPPNKPTFQRWAAPSEALVIAIEPGFAGGVLNRVSPSIWAELGPVIGVQDHTIERLAVLCHEALKTRSVNGPLYVESVAAAILAHIAHTSTPLRRHAVGGLTPLQLRRARDFVERKLGDVIHVGDLAAIVHFSVRHFAQAFKSSIGVSPHQYVLERRLNRAKALLLAGSFSIAEIAAKVGFSSQSHLTTHFKRLYGMTPAQFRRDINAAIDHRRLAEPLLRGAARH